KTTEMTAEVGIDAEGKLWFDPFAGTPFEIESVSVSPSLAEKGSTVNSVELSWKTSKSISMISYMPEKGGIGTLDYDPPTTEGKDTVDLSDHGVDMSNSSIEFAFTRKNGEKTETLRKTVKISFANRVFMGVAEIPDTVDSDFIKSLSSGTVTASRTTTKTMTTAGGEYMWYACPANSTYGTPSFYDKTTGFSAGFIKVGEYDYTNVYGYTEKYQVWRSNRDGLGTATVEVK
ncbi:MAG: hypothetical protein NC395_12090, partial [Prevotella sp.]|nr:hypothetical protein [Prevotella sp.]